jgi:hypothetical protein
MIRAIDHIILTIFILPIGLVMCGIYVYLYGNVLHAVLHSAFMVLVAAVGLTFLNIFSIRLPFAADSRPGNQMGSMVGPMIASGIFLGIPIFIISKFGYGGYIGYSVCLVTALALNWALGRGRNHRIRKVAVTWEFPG